MHFATGCLWNSHKKSCELNTFLMVHFLGILTNVELKWEMGYERKFNHSHSHNYFISLMQCARCSKFNVVCHTDENIYKTLLSHLKRFGYVKTSIAL